MLSNARPEPALPPAAGARPDLKAEVARSMDADVALLAVIDDVLSELEELVASAEEIVELLRPAALPRGSHAIDLGCGKGIVSLALAEQLGLRVTGIDGLPAFVADARRRAAASALGERCSFQLGDLRDALCPQTPYDVALLLGCGNVLGGPAEAVATLRACVRPGGYIVLGDVFLADDAVQPIAGFECYADHATTLRMLVSSGDELVAECVTPPDETDDYNRENAVAIRRKIARIESDRPDLREPFQRYLATHDRFERLGCHTVVYATWLLRRSA